MIGAGARDRVITFQRRVTTRDAANALVETWPFYATARAAMTPLSDAERVRAQEVAASMTTRWVTNWTPPATLDTKLIAGLDTEVGTDLGTDLNVGDEYTDGEHR